MPRRDRQINGAKRAEEARDWDVGRCDLMVVGEM